MESLDKDRKFLTQGGVFTDDQIDAYIDLKFQEIYNFEHTPIQLSLRCITVNNLNFKKFSNRNVRSHSDFENKLRGKFLFFIVHFCA